MSWADDLAVTVEWGGHLAGPWDPVVDWAEIPDWVSIDTRTGIDPATGLSTPGECQIVVEDRDRDWDATNSAGLVSYQLLRGSPLRVTCTDGVTVWPVWRGFVDRVVSDVANGRATFVGFDGQAELSEGAQAESVWAAAVEASAATGGLAGWWRSPPDEGQVVVDASGGGADAVLPGDGSRFAGDGLVVGSSDGGFEWSAELQPGALIPARGGLHGDSYSIELWALRPPADFVGAAYLYRPVDYENAVSIEADGTVKFWLRGAVTAVSNRRVSRSTPTHIVCRRSASTATIWINGVDATGTTTGTPTGDETPIPAYFGGRAMRVDELAVWRRALADAEIVAHHAAGAAPWDGDTPADRADRLLDAAGWPSGLTDLDDTGTVTTLGPATLTGSTWADMERAAQSEQGLLWCDQDGKIRMVGRDVIRTATRHTTSQATWSDHPSATVHPDVVGCEFSARVENDVTVSWEGGEVRKVDDVQVAAGGRREASVDTVLHTQVEARSLAEWVLYARANGTTLTATPATIDLGGNTTARAGAVARRIGDRVTISAHPREAGDRATVDVLVASVAHHIGAGGQWTADYEFLPVAEWAAGWLWDVSEWDTDTRAVY